MFQIVEVQPVYCQITDGLIGSTRRPVSAYVYATAALAHKLAGIMSEREFKAFGDGHFEVVDLNAKPWPRAVWPTVAINDELPF